MGIEVPDHLVIGDGRFVSFRKRFDCPLTNFAKTNLCIV